MIRGGRRMWKMGGFFEGVGMGIMGRCLGERNGGW